MFRFRQHSVKAARLVSFCLVTFFLFTVVKLTPWSMKPLALQEAIRYVGQFPQIPKEDIPHDFSYLITPVKNDCGEEDQLFLGVVSAPKNRKERDAIRGTWGHKDFLKSHKAVVLFFLALPTVQESENSLTYIPDQAVQNDLKAEAEEFNDIVQEDFRDSYLNLSLKSVAMLKWVSTRCSGKFRFVAKIDDDVYLNLPLFLSLLRSTHDSQNSFLLGHVVSPGIRIPRRPSSDLYYFYPYVFYPPYVGGPTYGMPSSCVERLYNSCIRLKPVESEDVFITGFCAREAGIPIVDSVQIYAGKLKPEACEFKNAISSHKQSPEDIKSIHRGLLNDIHLKCDKQGSMGFPAELISAFLLMCLFIGFAFFLGRVNSRVQRSPCYPL